MVTMNLAIFFLIIFAQITIGQNATTTANSTRAVTKYLTFTTTSSSCHTHSASLTTSAPIATSAYTYHTEFTTTSTMYWPVVVTVTGSSTTGTSVVYEETTVTTTIPAQTLATSLITSSTVGTVTIISTFCVSGTPIVTETVYTGTYNPPNSTNTFSPFSSLHPTQVDCYESLITGYTQLLNVSASYNLTITLHPSVPATIITTTSTHTDFVNLSPSKPSYSVVETVTSPAVAQTTSRISSSCHLGETALTYDQKCAPSNLISTVGGSDIATLSLYSTIIPVSVPNRRDPSACCQLCQDKARDGCAAVSDQKGGGNCILYFAEQSFGNTSSAAGGAQCGVAFDYERLYRLPTNISLVVQSGCGTIEAPLGE